MIPLRLSASALKDYRTCEYLFARNHIVRLPEHEREPVRRLSFGETIHRAIALFLQGGSWNSLTWPDLKLLLEQNWDGAPYDDDGIQLADLDRAEEMLRRFYDDRYPAGVVRELAVEQRLTWANFHRGILAVGKLDRVCLLPESVIEVIDYKTGTRVLDAEHLARDAQVLIYRSLAGEAYRQLKPRAIRVTFYYLPRGLPVTVEFERDDFLEGWRRIEEVAERIREAMARVMAGAPVTEAFPLRRGVACERCQLRRHCDGILRVAHRDTEVTS